MKKSLATGRQTYAFSKTDEEFKALLEHPDTQVQALVAARLGVKSTIEETRTERFIGIALRGPMPVPLRYYAAHTGRWGGDDKLNLQNLPRTSPLKKAILAPYGYVIIDSDSSQIEARTLAWLAGQDDLVEAFDRGEDVYRIMASAIYLKAIEDVTKDERFVGKTTILGAGYGMGAAKF
jgi:DNA polymerase